MATPKMTKNQMRRAKKKEEKKAKAEASTATATKPEETAGEAAAAKGSDTPETAAPAAAAATEAAEAKKETAAADVKEEEVDARYADYDYDDPAFAQFKEVFSKFGPSLYDETDEVARAANAGNQGEVFRNDEFDMIPDEDGGGEDDDGDAAPKKLSKKKRKQLDTLSIAELKALVRNPEVVEWHDVSSSDPRMLVVIKAQKNIVPVPGHWSLKREYLSSKRGVEKPPFLLPPFIAETGIAEMRDAVLEKQAEQTLKQKQRERVQPKMGKLDIDYQKLYDAFFRFQTKPPLTRFGDVYYEGKEWETEYRNFQPGAPLSEALCEALNIPPGFPPTWLLQQQRIGPPPSYPNLKIPGLNAPLPPGASWGFAPGQWGKPPVDEFNRPLYGGDIFGVGGADGSGAFAPGSAAEAAHKAALAMAEPIERTLWGELQPPEEESEEEEEEDDEDEDEDEDDEDGGGADARHVPGSGLETPGGYQSTVLTDYPTGAPVGGGGGGGGGEAGLDLRKQRRGGYDTEESAVGGAPRSAYTVIPERQAQAQGFFGSDRAYDLGGKPVLGAADEDSRKRKKPGVDVDVTLDPDALPSKEELQRKFEEGRREEGVGAQWRRAGGAYDEDLSEMIAQESRKRQKVAEERKADKKKETKYRF